MTKTKISDLVESKIAESPEFAKAYREERERNKIAVELMLLRESEGLSQRQLAKKAGKPQSTIARIERGNVNVSLGVLREIAHSVGKTVEIKFV